MPHKQILFRSAAREKILHGATTLADAVRVTLGPKSRCVLLEKKWGTPVVCNDGVTIAKEVDLKDPEENLGARMIRQAAEKTGELVGDGTTTATILAHALFDAARGQYVDLMEAGIIDPTKVVRTGLENAVSVAGILLLTEATLTEMPEPKGAEHAAPMME